MSSRKERTLVSSGRDLAFGYKLILFSAATCTHTIYTGGMPASFFIPVHSRRVVQSGFTLIELILVMGIVAVLYGISSVSLSRLIPRVAVRSTAETLRSELRLLQARAMQGDVGIVAGPSAFGVFFAADRYTFFEGSSYVPGAQGNVETIMEEAVSISTELPSNILVFQHGSGEVVGFMSGQDTITISNVESGESAGFTVNQYGVLLDE